MNNDSIYSIVFEKIDNTIDDDIKKLLQSQKVRKEMLKKYGSRAFLDSKQLKFPIINPKTGSYDCKLIYAALLRSAVWSAKGGSSTNSKSYYDDIKNKAKLAYESNNCGEKLKVKLTKESIEEIDITIINKIFNLVLEDHDKLISKTNYIG